MLKKLEASAFPGVECSLNNKQMLDVEPIGEIDRISDVYCRSICEANEDCSGFLITSLSHPEVNKCRFYGPRQTYNYKYLGTVLGSKLYPKKCPGEPTL